MHRRVAFVCNHSRLGGDNRSILSLAEGLQKSGTRSFFIVPEHGLIEAELARLKIPVSVLDHRVREDTSRAVVAARLARYMILLSKNRIDLVHANDMYCNRLVGIASRILRLPVVCHIRDHFTPELLKYYLVPCPSAIIFNSAYMLRAFDTVAGSLDCPSMRAVAYNGFEPERYYVPEKRTEVRAEWRIDERQVAVGIISNIAESKGHLDFVQMAARLAATEADYRFVVVGDDISEGRPTLRRMEGEIAALNLQDRFVFTGFQADVGRVLAGIDIAVFPSWKETFGRVAVEALLAGRPVVATRTGGLIEILEGIPTSTLCDCGNVEQLASAVSEARAFLPADRLRERVRIETAERFSVSTSVAAVSEVYEKATRRPCGMRRRAGQRERS